jgi:5'-AMP-activated protein kinase catalytic alpha subunit
MLKKIGDYNVYETIGQGGFGIVKKIKHSISGKEFAVKILDKKILRQNELGESLKKEIVFMKMIDHPNVVKLHEVLSSRSKFFMVMELIPDGDLFSHLEKKDFLPEDESRNIFQ